MDGAVYKFRIGDQRPSGHVTEQANRSIIQEGIPHRVSVHGSGRGAGKVG